MNLHKDFFYKIRKCALDGFVLKNVGFPDRLLCQPKVINRHFIGNKERKLFFLIK